MMALISKRKLARKVDPTKTDHPLIVRVVRAVGVLFSIARLVTQAVKKQFQPTWFEWIWNLTEFDLRLTVLEHLLILMLAMRRRRWWRRRLPPLVDPRVTKASKVCEIKEMRKRERHPPTRSLLHFTRRRQQRRRRRQQRRRQAVPSLIFQLGANGFATTTDNDFLKSLFQASPYFL